MPNEIETANQEVIEKRKPIKTNGGTGLLNIVERPSELAGTERPQRDSIDSHIGQLGTENDVAPIIGRRDFEYHTSKTA